MSQPLVSIVIATYNRAHSIVRSLESCLSQTYTNIEVVVVDDGSTDDTETVVQNIVDPRVRYVKLEHNGGASAARNLGIHESKGAYIIVWDSDDTLDPEAVATLMTIMDSHLECVVVSAPARMIKNGHPVSMKVLPDGYVSLEDVLCKRIGNDEKVRMARRDAYLRAPYVSRNLDFIVGARLRAQGTWYHLNTSLGDVFLNNPDSLTEGRKRFNWRRSADRAPYLESFLTDFGPALKKACPERYSHLVYGAATACAFAGMRKSARRYAVEVVRLAPLSWRSYMVLLLSIIM